MNGATKKGGCPICGRPHEPKFRPFCSKRCADLDLGRWFGERYVVSEPALVDEEEEKGPEGAND